MVGLATSVEIFKGVTIDGLGWADWAGVQDFQFL